MVSHSHRGLRDWLAQRISAVVIGAYVLFLVIYLLMHPHLDYAHWRALFNHTWMRVFTLLTLVSIVWHGWIGLWTVSTDYIKPKVARFLFQCVVMAGLLIYLVWGVCSVF